MTMVAQMKGKGNEQGRAVRPLNSTALARLVAQGGEVRRGTNLSAWQPAWEFQWFNSAGEFVAPIGWRAFQKLHAEGLVAVNWERQGVNRK